MIFRGFIDSSKPVLDDQNRLPFFYGKSSNSLLAIRLSQSANSFMALSSIVQEAQNDIFKLEDLLKSSESQIQFALHTKFDRTR
jgi:hypothetical protein